MKLAIEGHSTQGSEVIARLKMLGGMNTFNLNGSETNCYYYIDDNDNIYHCLGIDPRNYIYYTLEEFLEKFPYKVGDKVYYQPIPQIDSVCISEIISMKWIDGSVVYYTSNGHEVYVCGLQPYKEEAMEDKLEQITFDIPNGYEFFGINDDNQVVLAKKQSQYPKTFIEVLNFWHPDRQIEDDYQRCYKKDLIEKFQDLLYARDAYWKIAGDWEEKRKEKAIHYVIYSSLLGEVVKDTMPNCIANYLLDFPTEEMRNAFYENFKDLIEQCKELL